MAWLTDTPIAHRGLHNNIYPENSLGAARNAMDHGYPIELDLHLSADDRLIVFHDDTMARVCGDPRKVSDLTAEELGKVHFINSEECIPTFDEFLDLVSGQVPLLIEIKTQGSKKRNIALAQALLKRLESYEGEYALQSFDPFIMRWLYKQRPDITRGQLCAGERLKEVHGISSVLQFFCTSLLVLRYSKPDFIAYQQAHVPNRHTLREHKKRPLIVWTVRTAARAQELKPYVDNIIFQEFSAEK